MQIASKLGEAVAWVVGIYAALFLFWILAMFSCTDGGFSVQSCRENTLTRVVTYPFSLIRK